MKKIIFFTAVALLATYANAQDRQEYKEYYENGQLHQIGMIENGNPTGEWKFYDENGQLVEIGKYENGNPTGEWRFYDENGQLKEIGKYENGNQTGEWRFYEENGQLEKIGRFENGKENGEWKEYYRSGKIKVIKNYSKGEWHGDYKSYHENGQLSNKSTYKNFNKIGESLSYHENGTLMRKEYYNTDGQLEGESNTYFENGKLKINIKVLGIGHFHTKIYNENGDLKRESITTSTSAGKYWGYQQNGLYKDYNADGTLAKSFHVNKEKFDGECTVYYNNGAIALKIIFAEGMIWTVLEQNDINGKPLKIGSLNDGTGSMNYYDDNGKLLNTETYIQGIKQE
jgi:antitoxin component YwqK of YwqJK toxin-antitoxin module